MIHQGCPEERPATHSGGSLFLDHGRSSYTKQRELPPEELPVWGEVSDEELRIFVG